MKPEVRKFHQTQEYWFEEGCWITEVANDPGDAALSIARARVAPGEKTAWHRLEGIEERYLIAAGRGRVEIGASLVAEVGPGDVVRIPADTRQRITNTAAEDLVFFAVCTPPFAGECYVDLDRDGGRKQPAGDGGGRP